MIAMSTDTGGDRLERGAGGPSVALSCRERRNAAHGLGDVGPAPPATSRSSGTREACMTKIPAFQ